MELSLGDHMGKKQIEELYKALNNSEHPDKEELKREAGCCINSLIEYFNSVVNEQLYYSSTNTQERKVYEMKLWDEQRSKKHDDCIRACCQLNDTCSVLNVDKICSFNVEDRTQVAQFCGYFISSLYFSNIRCNEDLTKWLESCPLNQ